MQQEKNLNGIQVWVTRPAHQAKPLSKIIIAQGGQVILFPLLEIHSINPSQKILSLCRDLSQIDYIVFISPNAVDYGVKLLLQYGKIPEQIKLITIGQASTQRLQQLTARTADISPIGQYNSETLLAHPQLSDQLIETKQFIIFRGLGGRELLADVLRQRGAIVTYAEVYQRLKPKVKAAMINRLWHSYEQKNNTARIIILSSNEALLNLFEIFRQSASTTIFQQLLLTPLIVITQKMRLNALELGFKSTIISTEKSTNEAILKSLEAYKISL